MRCPLAINGSSNHPGGNPGSNFNSISHKCYPREVAFEWELTGETIYLPLGCLQGGSSRVGPCACWLHEAHTAVFADIKTSLAARRSNRGEHFWKTQFRRSPIRFATNMTTQLLCDLTGSFTSVVVFVGKSYFPAILDVMKSSQLLASGKQWRGNHRFL